MQTTPRSLNGGDSRLTLLRLCRVLAVFAAVAVVSSAFATITTVSTLGNLQSAIDLANPGDCIILVNGTYTANSPITITRVGTSSAPILIKAASTGGVTIGGSSGFQFLSPAAWVAILGFKFTHSGDQLSIGYGTSHCRLSGNTIQCTIAPAGQAYVVITGDDAEVDHNELLNKNSVGQGLDIKGDGISQVARRLWVHHNYFHDFAYQNGANGCETVRWGLGLLSLSTGDGLMEFNLFNRCDSEAEMVSNKSSGNTFRYNTFLNTVNSQFTLRSGNDSSIYGNYFINTVGLRIFGDRHQIFSNYFMGNSGGINIGNGDVQDGPAGGGGHDLPDNCVIVFNTLINNTDQYWMDTHYTLGASNITFANNIISGGPQAATMGGPYATPVWSNNIIWNTSRGDMPVSGYTSVNPLLVSGTDGVFHIQAGSPAIGAATGTYPAVVVDMDGQPRPGTGKDIGADQFSSAPITSRLLTASDVGPSSVKLVTPTITSLQKLNATTNKLTFTGPSGQTYKVLASTNLTQPSSNWSTISIGLFGSNAATFTDTGATTAPRFYRISSP